MRPAICRVLNFHERHAARGESVQVGLVADGANLAVAEVSGERHLAEGLLKLRRIMMRRAEKILAAAGADPRLATNENVTPLMAAAGVDFARDKGAAAVEAYPDLTRGDNETSGARPGFWHTVGFVTAVDDERFPVMRREL